MPDYTPVRVLAAAKPGNSIPRSLALAAGRRLSPFMPVSLRPSGGGFCMQLIPVASISQREIRLALAINFQVQSRLSITERDRSSIVTGERGKRTAPPPASRSQSMCRARL